MMNVNLSLTREELDLISVSVRMHLGWMEQMSQSEYIPQESVDRYNAEINMVPRILDILTTLNVKRIMHDAGIVETVNV